MSPVIRVETKSQRHVMQVGPRTWLGKVFALAAALAVLLLVALFFLLFAVLVIAILPILIARAIWLRNSLRPKDHGSVLDGEFSVVPNDSPVSDPSSVRLIDNGARRGHE